MNRFRCLLVLSAMLWAVRSGTASGQVTLTKQADLNFGSMVSGPSAGTVTVSVTGAVTSTGGVTLVPATTHPASFILANGSTGGAHIYLIQLPTSVTLSSGAHTMVVDNFDNTTPNLGILASNSSRTIDVGATLNVGANQASGTYTGTFLMMVSFL